MGHGPIFSLKKRKPARPDVECDKVLEAKSPDEPDTPFWQTLDDTRPDETADWSEVEFVPGATRGLPRRNSLREWPYLGGER